MEKLRVPAASGSRELQRASGSALPTPSYRSGNLPPVLDVLTDVTIPRSAWSGWIPDNGKQQLRRPLTEEERSALERRRDELEPAVAGYQQRDIDHVALALTDMFGGYTSMRQSGEEAVARIDSVRRILMPFPAWAIERACTKIQTNGVYRDGKYDRRWPPNDSDTVAAVRDEVRLYAATYRNVVAMLEATVDQGPR